MQRAKVTSVGTKQALLALTIVALLFPGSPLFAGVLFFQGFEADTASWDIVGGLEATRVASGTHGIASSAGGFHAEIGSSPLATNSTTNWGGYNFDPDGAVTSVPGIPFPTYGYKTSIDIFLDVGAGLSDDVRFDFSSAINELPSGDFRRGFVFNGGFYDSTTDVGDGSPGAGTNRFVFTASNNSGRANSYPKNPGRDPIAISATGWYTFEHNFIDQSGVLAVEMSILDAFGTTINTWTLSDPTDTINSGLNPISGNRYGWLRNNELPLLAFDETSLELNPAPLLFAIPEPATRPLVAAGLILGLTGRRRKKIVTVHGVVWFSSATEGVRYMFSAIVSSYSRV